MKKVAQAAGEQLRVPFRQVHVPKGPRANIRKDLPKVKEIAESLRSNGQLYPVIVTRDGGTKEKPFVLLEGFRRMAAFEILGWQGREIMVVVREHRKGDHIGRIADNFVANAEREPLHPLDMADCARSLVDGTYDVPDGEEARPYAKEEVAERLGLSRDHLVKLLKLARTLTPDVADKARKVDAPLRVILPISQIAGEGKDEEAVLADQAKRQDRALEQWVGQQRSLAEQGRQRAERSDKGKKGKKADEPSPAPLSPSKKIGTEGTALRRPVSDYVAVVGARLETAKGSDRSYYEGMVDAFRFMIGELKKLKGVTSADFRSLDVEPDGESVE